MITHTVPIRLFFVFAITCFIAPTANAQVFEDCRSSGSSATILVSSSVDVTFGPNNTETVDSGDRFAAYTTDDECAGKGAEGWSGSMMTVPGFASDQLPGYEPDEPLVIYFYDSSTEQTIVFEAENDEITFTPCSELPGLGGLCKDTGLFEADRVYQIESLSEGSVLPVELTSFNANVDGSTVALTWETASETNNAGFWVQHQPPRQSWTDLSFVNGNGTTSEVSRYTFRTGLLEPGTHRFRLQQVDTDGTSTLSTIQTLIVRTDGSHALSSVRPHPVTQTGSWSLTVAETQPIVAEIYNLIGKRVATLLDRQVGANQRIDFALDVEQLNLASGTYFLRIRGPKVFETQRVSIVR